MLLQTGEDPAELAEAQLRRVTEFACASAGLSKSRYGGIARVPSYEQVMAVVNRKYPTNSSTRQRLDRFSCV